MSSQIAFRDGKKIVEHVRIFAYVEIKRVMDSTCPSDPPVHVFVLFSCEAI